MSADSHAPPIVVTRGVDDDAADATSPHDAAQRRSEAQYRLLFASNPLPMWVFDRETLRFLAVNRAAVAAYGYTRDEFLSMTIRDIRPAGAGRVLDKYVARGDPGGQIAGVWPHRRKDGSLIDVEVSSNAIEFDGRAGRLVLAHDVTGRRRAERQLQKTEAILAIAGRVARVAGWSFDLKTHLFAYSDELCAMHDLPAGSTVSLHQALDFYAPECRATMLDAVNACAQDGTAYDLELELITAKARRIGVRTIGQAVRNAAGAIVGTQGAVQDITEKKLAEGRTRALAARLTTTLESITDAFFTLDREWRFTYVNAQAERLLERPRVDLLGEKVWDVFPQSVGNQFDRQYRRAVRLNEAVAFEGYNPFVRRWFDVNAYPSEAGLTVCFRDVTERRRSEEHLRLLETCVARMNDVVIITEADAGTPAADRIVFVNDAFVRCTGYRRDEVLGRSPRLLQGPQTQRLELDRIARALRGGEPVRAELINYKKGGAQYWVELDIVPLRTPAGNLTHFVAVQRDTTERRLAQEALRSSNENLEAKVAQRTVELELSNGALASKEEEIRSVVEFMADGVVTFDDLGIIGSANPMVESIFGVAPAQLVGRNIATLIPALGAQADGLVNGGSDTDTGAVAPQTVRETTGRHCSGAPIALDVAVSHYRIKGRRLWTAIVRDIGERVAIMADLERARHDAEQASRAKSAFVATMSHEIRTPMNGVIGMIDVLEQTELAPAQSRMLELAKDSAASLMAIIEDILDFSKIEAGRVEIEREPMSVRELVESACALVSSAAASDTLNLDARVDPEVPSALLGDATRVRQVLVNLLGNAVKFSSGPGRVARVGLAVTMQPGASGPMELELAVSDNGVGMDAGTIGRLFTPFSQADASTTRRFGGTGLGLAISMQLVELMGGRIQVSSTPNVGSTFTVRLPFTPAPPPAPRISGVAPRATGAHRSRRAADAPPRGGLILVAEDNRMCRLVLAEQLALLGFGVEMVDNGRDALERWRSGRFAVVLTDLQMPGMDGYGLAVSIRSEEEGRTRTPIIALTANALGEEAGRCKAAGMDDYLTKPARMPALEAVLVRWIGPAGSAAGPTVGPAVSAHGDPVDPCVLPRFVGDEPAVLGEFFADFARTLAQAAAALEKAMVGGHRDEAAAVAHRIKAAARAVGALRLGDLCADIESAARDANDVALAASWRLFDAEAARVQWWIEARRAGAAGASLGVPA